MYCLVICNNLLTYYYLVICNNLRTCCLVICNNLQTTIFLSIALPYPITAVIELNLKVRVKYRMAWTYYSNYLQINFCDLLNQTRTRIFIPKHASSARILLMLGLMVEFRIDSKSQQQYHSISNNYEEGFWVAITKCIAEDRNQT